MDEAFLMAPRDRGIPEENLQKMINDKVDQEVIKIMDEETLEKYIPHFGDLASLPKIIQARQLQRLQEMRKEKKLW